MTTWGRRRSATAAGESSTRPSRSPPRAASTPCRCGPSPSRPTSPSARSTATSRPRSTSSSPRWRASSRTSRPRLGRRTIPGDTPADRVEHVLTRATRGLQRDPQLTEALTRAFMFADSTVASEIHVVGLRLTAMLNRALQGDAVRRGLRADRRGDRRRARDQRRLAGGPRLLGHRPPERRRGRRAPRDRRPPDPALGRSPAEGVGGGALHRRWRARRRSTKLDSSLAR